MIRTTSANGQPPALLSRDRKGAVAVFPHNHEAHK